MFAFDIRGPQRRSSFWGFVPTERPTPTKTKRVGWKTHPASLLRAKWAEPALPEPKFKVTMSFPSHTGWSTPVKFRV